MNKKIILQTNARRGGLLGSLLDLVVLTSLGDDFIKCHDFYFI